MRATATFEETPRLQQLSEQPSRPPCTGTFDRPVVHLPRDFLRDGSPQGFGLGDLVVEHATAGTIPRKPVADMVILLEMSAEGHVDERPPVRGELHASGQATLNYGQVAAGQLAMQVGDIATD